VVWSYQGYFVPVWKGPYATTKGTQCPLVAHLERYKATTNTFVPNNKNIFEILTKIYMTWQFFYIRKGTQMPLHLTLLVHQQLSSIEEFLIILKIVYWKKIPPSLVEKVLKIWSHDIFTSGLGFMHDGCFAIFWKIKGE